MKATVYDRRHIALFTGELSTAEAFARELAKREPLHSLSIRLESTSDGSIWLDSEGRCYGRLYREYVGRRWQYL